MRYVYGKMGNDWQVTILATDTQESEALRQDAKSIGAELIFSHPSSARFVLKITKTLAERRHDLIQSQGVISAAAVSVANIPFRKPHVLTVHGILEECLLQGVKGRVKRTISNVAIRSVDVIYAVSEDILEHIRSEVPGLSNSHVPKVAILNGIESELFLTNGTQPGALRARHGLSEHQFLFGFLGRFMPQKGFDKVIEALAVLEKEGGSSDCDYHLIAVGSGDYRNWYQKMAEEHGVTNRILFVPFQRDVAEIFHDLDAVIMPSRWEACGLLAMEALASGVPLITSDCIGLREVVQNTPAFVVPDGKPEGLAKAMKGLLVTKGREPFQAFRAEAARRFDVRNTAEKVKHLFEGIIHRS